MDLFSWSGLIAYAHTEEAHKKLRYAGVTVVFLPIGQILIQVFGLWLDNYAAASLLAAGIVVVPSFFANRHFVWRIMSRENLRSQVVVFWVAMMLGVTLATLFTHVVENAMVDQTVFVRGSAVSLAQLLGYGIVWVGRYLILDRWLFKGADDMLVRADVVIGEVSA
jgi:putative flippase GtrA